MADVIVKFEGEEREGIVAVGTYLIDAARRFGIRISDDELESGKIHTCLVEIASGGELLSEPTKVENEHFATHGRKDGQRLSCQTKIDKPGEVVIMTDKKKTTAETEAEKDSNERYRKEFEEMPLETKIANLVRLEAIAFGETVSFVANSPFKIADKLMDIMAEFGMKKDESAKNSQRPDEHKKNASGTDKKKASKSGGAEAGAEAL